MADRTGRTTSWLRGLFGAGRRDARASHPGREALVAGGRALWILASRAVDTVHAVDVPAGGGETAPSEAVHAFGGPARVRMETEPRAAVAAAVGAALAGRRATAFVPGGALPALVPALTSAARRHVPLTVVAAHEPDDVATHDPFHAAAAAGVPLFVARDAQHAVDLYTLAVRIAEDTLTPVVVAVDGPSAAWAPSSLRLPETDHLRAWLGNPAEIVDAPTATQRSLFGGRRPRVPRWFDPDRPALTGATLAGPGADAAAAADRAVLAAERDARIEELCLELESMVGRPVLSIPREDGERAILALGEDVGLLRAVAEFLGNGTSRPRIVPIPSLTPFHREALADACRGARRVVVLERVHAGTPLTDRVHAAVGELGVPVSTWTWIRGDGATLAAALDDDAGEAHLGARSPADATTRFPRRRIALERLRRDHPDLGVRLVAADAPIDLRPEGAATAWVAVREPAWPREVADEVAEAIAAHAGDRVRGRVVRGGHGHWTLRVTAAERPFDDPADDAPPDVVAALDPEPGVVPDAPAGTPVLVRLRSDDTADLPPDWLRVARDRGWRLYGRRDLDDRLGTSLRGALAGSFDGLLPIEPDTVPADAAVDGQLPAVVRRFERAGDDWAGLPRFWNEWIEPTRGGEARPAVADPFPALRAVPPYTATLDDRCGDRERTPAIDPAKCTACGRCWTSCPEAAILPVAFPAQTLLDAAADAVAGDLEDPNHPAIGKLRRVHKQVAARLDAAVSSDRLRTAGCDEVRAAYHAVIEKLGLDDADRVVADRLVDGVCGWVAGLPVASPDATFHAAHAAKKGDGSLLLLAVDPAACNGCGICTHECADDAIARVEGTGDLAAMRRAVRAWETMPDTPGDIVKRIASREDVGPMASVLLSRHAACTLLGGGDSAPGSGARLAVRLTTAAAEAARQPAVADHVRTLDELGEKLETAVRDAMARTLDVGDLDVLDRALDGVARKPGNAGEVVDRLTEAGEAAQVDTVRVRRLVQAVRDVRALSDAWSGGDSGLGRARFALVVAGRRAARWAGGFPHNPFGVPVTVDEAEDGADVAAGIARALRERHVDEARTVRLARLLLDDPDDLPARERDLDRLAWTDLDEDERALVPRPVVLLDGDALRGPARAGVPRLLASDVPATVLAIDDGDPLAPGPDPVLDALAQREAYVVAGSPSHPDVLFRGAAHAFTFDGPSFVHVLAPEPGLHGYPTDRTVERARGAVRARVQPLLRYDPAADGVFGLRLDLDGNPATADLLAPAATDAADGDAPEPASWAAGERRYARDLRTLDDGENGVPFARWSTLSPDARNADVPTVPGPNGRRLGVGVTLSAAALRRVHHWRTLQELAGLETPFTERIRERLEGEAETVRNEALDALRREYESKLAAQRDSLDAEQVDRLRDRLLQLAGYDPSKAPRRDAPPEEDA